MAHDGWVLEFRIALVLSTLAIATLHLTLNDPASTSVAEAQPAETPAPEAVVENGPKGGGEAADDGPLVFESTGVLEIVPGTGEPSGPKPVRTFTVKVEEGVPVSPTYFARRVESILGDLRSWGGLEDFSVQRVDDPDADFHVILASPDTTDELCLPLDTQGTQSCQRKNRAILNAIRWIKGAETYGSDLASYRIYLVNHEVGHVWLHPHLSCPAAGRLAPVMVQQTIRIAPCKKNPWPLDSEAHV